jgi:hypothetical protein
MLGLACHRRLDELFNGFREGFDGSTEEGLAGRQIGLILRLRGLISPRERTLFTVASRA